MPSPPAESVFDLVIVGSGIGALTAAIKAHALGLSCVVIEKSSVYGGSSAMSGGTMWVPCNHLQGGAGVEDRAEDALGYLASLAEASASPFEEALVRRFLSTAPKALLELEQLTALRFELNAAQPDYHSELPGGRAGGRSVNPRRFAGRRLGAALDRLRPSHPQTLIGGRVGITAQEARAVLDGSFRARCLLAKLLLAYVLDLPGRLRGPRDRQLTMGNALIGPLRLALLEREIPLWLDSPVTELLREGGRVCGVTTLRAGESVRVLASRGVLLAAGGFAGNQALRDRYLPGPSRVEWSAANRDNTGDALRMGQAVGAGTALLDQAWFTPTLAVPGRDLAWILVVERSRPGCLLVDGGGRRFASEGLPYEPAVRAMHARAAAGHPCAPAYLIFDARYRRDYPCGPIMPGYVQPDARLAPELKQGFLLRAPTLEALAAQIDVEPVVLVDTLERFNHHAARGKDPEFGKGDDAYSRYYGDPQVKPNPCLRPLESKGPYYALAVQPGDLGTKGGLRIDPDARVLDQEGRPIPGLYAAGNSSAAVFGATYPGAGATLAPAMTFAWLAACAAARADC